MSLKAVTTNEDKNGYSNVVIQYGYNTKSKRFPTGVKVKKAGFEDEKLVKCGGRDWKEHNEGLDAANEKIAKVKADLAFIIRRYTEDNKVAPTLEQLGDLYNAPATAAANETTVTFLALWKEYLDMMEAKVSGNAGYNTARSISPVGKLLLEFEKARAMKLTLASFNYALMSDFQNFLIAKGQRNSTVRTRVALLKTFLNWTVKMKGSKHVAFREFTQSSKFQNAPKGQRIVALSVSELDEFMALKPSDSKLRYAQDLFTLCAATGLRFIDAIRVKPTMIHNDAITIITEKTGEELTIPLNWMSKQVLAKYPAGMRSIDLGTYNARLRTLAQMCDSLHTHFRKVTFSGLATVVKTDKEEEEMIWKWQHITSHVGRKTFVTRCLVKGIPEYKIRKYTGHKDLTSFVKYIDNQGGDSAIMEKF